MFFYLVSIPKTTLDPPVAIAAAFVVAEIVVLELVAVFVVTVTSDVEHH
jgi:hypothetical protein